MLGGFEFWLLLTVGLAWALWGPRPVREAGLGALALAFVLWHDVLAGCAYLGLAIVVWRVIRAGQPPPAKATALIVGLAVGFVFCEYVQARSEGAWHIPLGFSYLVFRLIHVTVDARRKAWRHPPSAGEFAHFLFSPALFVAGPLERWAHWSAAPAEPASLLVAEGVQRLLLGLVKKVLVADLLIPALAARWGWALPIDVGPAHPASALWQACLFAYLKIYAEFSGYSDIAVGAGLLWGRRPMENFNWPVIAATPADFWRRWHISIAQWCSDCIYLPLMGRLRNVVVPMLASFVVMGLWHGLGWNRVGWALWQVGGLLVFITWQKRMGRPKAGGWRSSWAWRLASIGLTQAFVVASYGFMLHGETVPVGESFVLIARMWGWSP